MTKVRGLEKINFSFFSIKEKETSEITFRSLHGLKRADIKRVLEPVKRWKRHFLTSHDDVPFSDRGKPLHH